MFKTLRHASVKWYNVLSTSLHPCDPTVLLSLGESCREPVKTFVESISSSGATRLYIPLSVAQAVESELVGHLGSTHGVGKILLVGKDEKD